MPWDPKPAPPAPAAPTPAATLPSAATNGLSNSYSYDTPSNSTPGDDARIKTEPGTEGQFANGYPQQQPPQPQGGLLRAQQLVQQYGGQAATASVNAMQRGNLALPGQQQRPQGLQLPAQPPNQQQLQMLQQRQMQQAQARQQQDQTQIKVESGSPSLQSSATFSQTDGAGDGYDEWKAMLAERRAISAEQTAVADRMMRERITEMTAGLESGLMVPLDQQPARPSQKRRAGPSNTSAGTVPQYDGDADDDDEPKLKSEDDEDAINSDLDDSDDDQQNQMGDDDDENGDSILCTYDKVQRVKNKWKCTLKDGVMSVGGKEYVFHKGTGEFEW